MVEIIEMTPIIKEVGSWVIIVVLLWYMNRQAVRQHERTLKRDEMMSNTINDQNVAILECVEKRTIEVMSTPRN